MKHLVILNDPPYGTERSYNALRLAMSLSKKPETEVKVFLMADAAACGKAGQRTPDGCYNLERMLKSLTAKGIEIGVCGTCMDARGMTQDELITGLHRGTMEELTDWTLWADKVIVF